MTAWRQGTVLSSGHALHSANSLGDEKRLVVITHDCDLAGGHPRVEAIVARFVVEPDGNLTRARHPRTLHVEFERTGGVGQWMELAHEHCVVISCAYVSDDAAIDDSFSLAAENKRILRRWLASRYGRPAFPSAFEDRLKSPPMGGKSVGGRLDKIIKNVQDHLVGVFFDLGEDRDEELDAESPYGLVITLVYDTTKNAPEARESSRAAAERVKALFQRSFGEGGNAAGIDLESCDVVPDSEFSVLDLRRNDHWRVEYMSMGSDSSGNDILDVDETLL